MATQFSEVINSFHSSFVDKKEIPDSLEMMWLKKATGGYSTEINPLEYNEDIGEFKDDLSQYTIDVLATTMKVLYLQRECSRVNKIASIVGNDLSVNSGMSLSKYAEEELNITKTDLIEMLGKLKTTAYN